MNKLNGWQRAWVVLAIVWAAPMLFFLTVNMPESPHRIQERQRELRIQYAKDEEIAAAQGGKWPGEWFSPDLSDDELVKIKTYPHDLALHVSESAAVWAFPLIAVYLLGMGVAWIRAGFRTKPMTMILLFSLILGSAGQIGCERHDKGSAVRAWPLVAVTPSPDAHSDEDVLTAWLSNQIHKDNFGEIKAPAEKGDTVAQLVVADHYEMGVRVERDYGEALKWIRKAADQNDAWAQYRVAQFYSQGRGVDKDEAESLSWLLKAAYNGLIDAQIEVARHYYQGIGVKPSVVEAYAWLNVTAARRTKSEGLQRFAAEQRDGMEEQMTTAEVTAAQKRARELAALLQVTQAASPRQNRAEPQPPGHEEEKAKLIESF